MERALRQTVVIGPEGRVEIPTTELTPGTSAEIIVLPIDGRVDRLTTFDREATLRRMWELSDGATADGMEAWDVDQINAEISDRRYGDREHYR